MPKVAIAGTGLFTPSESISNEELVKSFNDYVERFNAEHEQEITAGTVEALNPSSAEFIQKASGIKSRYVMDKAGVLDVSRMVPNIPERPNTDISVLAEMAVVAAQEAIANANIDANQVDAVIVACSNPQRAYPAIAVEVQHYLGIDGFAFDMNVACSSATFGIQTAMNMIQSGSAQTVLMVNPEICTGHLNFRDRDSHFIFGDGATAVVLQDVESLSVKRYFEVLDTRLKTVFSNNIRNNFGFLNRADESGIDQPDKLFIQEGRKVFKEVSPMVAGLILDHLEANSLSVDQIKRLWLHQANINMNQLISRRVLGRDADVEEAPVILDRFANTSSAGSIICFHSYQQNLEDGDLGVICSFGAGYSIGNVIVKAVL